MAKLTLSSILSSFSSITTLNANFQAIVTAFENTLSRDGTSPNAMGADLDMNSNRIINLPAASTATEAVRYDQAAALVQDNAIQYQGDWATSTSYVTNNAVTNDGSSYVALSDHTSDASTEPGVGGSWETVWAVIAEKGDQGETGDDGLFTGSEATVSPAAGDLIPLKDISDSNNPKFATASDIVALGGGGAGGMWTFVETFSDTSVTSLNVDIPSAQEIMLVVDYLPTTDDDDFTARVTIDSFSNVVSTSNYSYTVFRSNDNGTGVSTIQATGADRMFLSTFGSGNDTGEFTAKHLIVRGANSASRQTVLEVRGTRINGANNLQTDFGAARYDQTTVVDGIQFFMNGGGTFAEITVHVYSLVTA